MPVKRLEVPIFGNTSDLERAMSRAGLVAEDASKKITGSFRQAGLAAAEESRRVGASVDEQAAAAGRAAAAFTEMSAKITVAQRNAGKAAATAAGEVGASVDEQRAAYVRAIATQAEYESAQTRAAEVAKKAAADEVAASRMAADAAKKAAAEQAVAVEDAHKRISGLGKWTLLGGLGAAAFSVKGAAELQKQMEMLHTQAGASQQQVAALTSGVTNMAGSVATSPDQLAKGLYHVVSNMNALLPASQRNAKELDALRVAAEGAKVGNANLEDVTNALGGAIASGIPGVQNYQAAMGSLNATVGAGDMRMQQLAEAYGTGLLAPMKTYGVSLRDVNAALAVFGDNNIRGAEAGTKLASAIRIMAAPAGANAKWLHAIGMGTTQLADDIRAHGLLSALDDLKSHLEKTGASASQQADIITRIFGGRQSTGVQLLLGQLDRFRAKQQQVADGSRKFGSDYQAYTHTLAGQTAQLEATVSALADKFGMYLIPKLQAVGTAVQSVIGWFGRHKAAAEALAATIAGVLGTAITVFAYTKAVAFVGATKDMLSGIGKFGAGVVSVAGTAAEKLGLISTTSATTATEVTAADAEMEAANATAGASFTAMGTEAAGAATAVESQLAGMVTATEAADTAIEGANAAAAASFMAMLGPIAAVGAAGYALAQSGAGGPLPAGQQPVGSGVGGRAAGLGGGFLTRPQLGLSPSAATRTGDPMGIAGHGGHVSAPNVTVPVSSSGPAWQRIAGALQAQGFSKVAIAGILGNFAQETGGGTLAGINTRDSGDGSSGMGGMGIGQWTGGRRAAEMQYAASHGESATSLPAQIGYLIQELRTSYHGVFTKIQHATSAQQAAALFDASPAQGGFEGGTDPGGIRERLAAQAYAMLAGGSSSGGASHLSPQLAALLNGTGSTAGGKATMRYVNHRPVGSMTEAQWQAYQAAHPTKTLLYSNPLAGDQFNVERTDQGKDYGDIQGPLRAVGAGVITLAQNLSGFGQTIVERLTAGPNKGREIYYGLETGARGVGLRAGMHVTAGQAVAQGLGTGGVELGFWNPATGRALDNQGFNGSNATPGGQAFTRFMQSLGARGIYTTSNTGSTGYTIAQAVATYEKAYQAFITRLANSASSQLTRYGNAIQDGSINSLQKLLGISTAPGRVVDLTNTTTMPGAVGPHHGRLGGLGTYRSALGPETSTVAVNFAAELRNRITGLGDSASMSQIGAATGSLLSAGEKGSAQERSFQQMINRLDATHNKHLAALARQLVAAHKQALAALGEELYAAQLTKDSESMTLQTTQLKDQTTQMANYDAARLDVTKAFYQKANDAADAQVTAIRDMTQTVTDQFSGMVQAIEDHAQQMSDATAGLVSGINDQTQIQVDLLGERGLYGLNLVAQKLQVQLDITKQYWDQQISTAQQNLDQVTATAHASESAAQVNLDQLTAQMNANVALTQQSADTIKIQQAIRLQSAQASVDAVTMHEDTAIVGPAQIAADLGAILPKAQQDVLNAQLKKATASAGWAEGLAGLNYQKVSDSVGFIDAVADQSVTDATATASKTIADAGLTLARVTGEANAVIATAQSTLSGVQGSASIAEATVGGQQQVTAATAQTQFAGGGIVLNVYGAPVNNAAAIADEVGWTMRTALAG